MSKKQIKLQEQQAAVTTLLTLLKPNDEVYTDIVSVSSSGMSRQILCFIPYISEEGKPRIMELTGLVSQALDLKIGSKGGIIMSGCGMDMAFQLVYCLGKKLWPNGTPEPHGKRNGDPDTDGGYALKKVTL